jgi:hypothetical protein
MKCVHCSTPLNRTDWFCPYCKRGIKRSQPRRFNPALPVVIIAGVLSGACFSLLVRKPAAAPSRAVEPDPVPVSVRTVVEESEAVPTALASLETPLPAEAFAARLSRRREEVRLAATERRVPHLDERHAGRGAGAVSVTTDSPVETYVYLNGGSLLGKTPLQDAQVPAGKQTLVFWTPAVGGRSTRRIEMRAGQSLSLVESVAHSARFAGPEGG